MLTIRVNQHSIMIFRTRPQRISFFIFHFPISIVIEPPACRRRERFWREDIYCPFVALGRFSFFLFHSIPICLKRERDE